MPKINWADVTETTGGTSQSLPGGAYKVRVTAARYERSKKGDPMLVLVWDVEEGPFRGFFSDDFYVGKDFRHLDRVMLAGKGLGVSKHKLHVLADANPGFKPTQAIDADQTQPFVGKVAYLLLRERLYTWDGRDRSEVRVERWLSPEEFAANPAAPEPLDERRKAPTAYAAPAVPAPPAPPVAPAPDLAPEDIPF